MNINKKLNGIASKSVCDDAFLLSWETWQVFNRWYEAKHGTVLLDWFAVGNVLPNGGELFFHKDNPKDELTTFTTSD